MRLMVLYSIAILSRVVLVTLLLELVYYSLVISIIKFTKGKRLTINEKTIQKRTAQIALAAVGLSIIALILLFKPVPVSQRIDISIPHLDSDQQLNQDERGEGVVDV